MVSLREEFPGVFDVQALCPPPAVAVSDAAQTLPLHRHPQPHAAETDRGRAFIG